MFTHRFAVEGNEACGRTHVTITEARECQEEIDHWMWEATRVYCSLCDGEGHGQPGYGPCPLEETGYWESQAQDDWEAARGVISFEDAYAAAAAL